MADKKWVYCFLATACFIDWTSEKAKDQIKKKDERGIGWGMKHLHTGEKTSTIRHRHFCPAIFEDITFL